MNKSEAKNVLMTIYNLYPGKFQLTEPKIEFFLPKLLEMDYELVMDKIGDFTFSHQFPPTLAEIAAYKSINNEHLKMVQKWDEEAAKVPEEIKQQFREKLQKLIEVKSK